MKNLHHYRAQLYYIVIDTQLNELNCHFDEANFKLLLCIMYLSPNDSFADFNKEKLLCLAQFYSNDFSMVQVITLDNQLEADIIDMRSSEEFAIVEGDGQLVEKMVETKK